MHHRSVVAVLAISLSCSSSEGSPIDDDTSGTSPADDSGSSASTQPSSTDPTSAPDETTEAKPKKTETRVVNGVKVSTVHFGSGKKESTLSYAVTDSMLLVAMGEGDILARALQNRGRGVSLWTRNDIAPLLASFPREACSLSYWDPSLLREKVKTARMDDERRQVVLMLLQQVGPSVGYTLKTPDGYFSHVRLRRAFP